MTLRQLLGELVTTGAERGLQVTIYRHGELLHDEAAGEARTGVPVTPGTVFNNFSIVKAATAALTHVLVGRGAFGYDTRLSELWPELRARTVTIRHVLTHSAGLAALPPDLTPERLCDWDGMCALLAGTEPAWEPGTRVAYHAYTFGFLLGEAIRRATGKPVATVLREELTGPLGIAGELRFGVPPEEQHTLAELTGDVSAPGNAAVPEAIRPTAEFGNRPDVLAADIPASGRTSARATARLYAALLTGELVPLDLLTSVAAQGIDEIFGNPSAWSLGLAIGFPTPTAFGMAGGGGSFGFADPATGIAVACTKNRLDTGFDTLRRVLATLPA